MEVYQDRRTLLGAAGRRIHELFDSSLVPQRQLAQYQRRVLKENPQANIPLISSEWLVDKARRVKWNLGYDAGAGVASTIFSGTSSVFIDKAHHVNTGSLIGDVILNAAISAAEWIIISRWDAGQGKEVQKLFNEYSQQLRPEDLDKIKTQALVKTVRS